MNDEKNIKTIRWDGTCRKCRVKTHFIPVKEKTIDKGLMCILCFWKIKDE
tara:strand:+ start:739 stop:888 length:150 start_codon:yes stop_codon:yes gene_type:complete